MLSLLNDLWQDKGQKEWEKQKLLIKQVVDSLELNAEQEKAISGVMSKVIEELPQKLFRTIARPLAG